MTTSDQQYLESINDAKGKKTIKRSHTEKAYYSIKHDGTPMTIGVEYDVLYEEDEYFEVRVILRSREFGEIRGFSSEQATVRLLEKVSDRHNGAKFVRVEKVSS